MSLWCLRKTAISPHEMSLGIECRFVRNFTLRPRRRPSGGERGVRESRERIPWNRHIKRKWAAQRKRWRPAESFIAP